MAKKLLMVSVSLASLGMAQAASAQTNANTQPSQQQQSSSDQQAPSAGNPQAATGTASNGGIADIIITATRQSTNLQSTPIAVTAVTAQQLEVRGLTNAADLGAIVPNAAFRRVGAAYGPGMSAFIRGIGQSDTSFASEPGVAFYVDDVYYPLVLGSEFDLLDLDHVETLRGPQGTLFGRNALAGAINLVTKQPSLTEASGYVDVTTGSYNRRDFRAGFNLPLSSTLAIKVSAMSRQQTGYQKILDFRCQMVKNGTPQLAGNFPYANGELITQGLPGSPSSCTIGHLGGQDVRSLRGQALWEPVPSLKITVSGDYTRDDSENAATSDLAINTTIANNNSNVKTMYNYFTAPGGPTFAFDSRFLTGSPYKTYATFGDPIGAGTVIPGNTFYNGSPYRGGDVYGPGAPSVSWGASGKAVLNIAHDIDLTLIGGYRNFKAEYAYDLDGSPLAIENTANRAWQTNYTGEFRITGKRDWIDWVAGLFYYSGRAHLDLAVESDFNNLQRYQSNQFNSTSKAVYANVTLHPFPRLSFVLGGRYSDDKKPVSFYSVVENTTAASTSLTFSAAASSIFGVDIGDKHADWKAGVNYQLTDQTLLYASVSTGSRLPGFNSRPLQPDQAKQFPGDKTQAYELGLKTDLFDHHLRFDGDVFYTDYKERAVSIAGQEYLLDANGNKVPGAYVLVASPSGQGVTVCQAAPTGTPGFACIGDTFYVNDPGKVKGVEGEVEANPFEHLSITGSFGYSQFTSPGLSARPATAPHRLSLVPEWTGSAGIQYDLPTPGLHGTFSPRLDWFYQGSIVYSATSNQYNQPGYSVFNGRVTYYNNDHDFSVAVGVNNIFNKFYWETMFLYQELGYPVTNGQPSPPREWLLTFSKKF